MNRKEKLANLILLETEALEQADGVTNILNLAQEIQKDAVELAKIILEEQKGGRMRKVIDIMTREPLKELIFDKATAEELIEYLLNYKSEIAVIDYNERYMVHQVLKFIENASGASAEEVLQRKGA